VVGAGIAAAAAIVALILVTTRDNGLGKPEIQSAIIPSSGQVQITGKASLYKPARPDGRVVLDVAGLPVTPAGHHYEVWVLRSGDTSMEAVGAFATDRTAPLHLDLRLPGGGRYAALDISIEDNGGPPEHSGKSVAGAKFGT
jgi:anti-sigma-K factor RskA